MKLALVIALSTLFFAIVLELVDRAIGRAALRIVDDAWPEKGKSDAQ